MDAQTDGQRENSIPTTNKVCGGYNDNNALKSLITNSFYRRMMHEENERPPNEKSNAYHFSITYNGWDFCLLTPPAILALHKCLFKGWRL